MRPLHRLPFALTSGLSDAGYVSYMTTSYVPDRTRRMESRGRHQSHDIDWSLLSPQGRVLFYVALCPHCSVEEIAIALSLTERSVWSIVRALRKMDMIRYTRDGRRHRYTINLDAPLLAPTIEGLTLRSVLGNLADEEHRDEAKCVRID